jgi:hypothetical protein
MPNLDSVNQFLGQNMLSFFNLYDLKSSPLKMLSFFNLYDLVVIFKTCLPNTQLSLKHAYLTRILSPPTSKFTTAASASNVFTAGLLMKGKALLQKWECPSSHGVRASRTGAMTAKLLMKGRELLHECEHDTCQSDL